MRGSLDVSELIFHDMINVVSFIKLVKTYFKTGIIIIIL